MTACCAGSKSCADTGWRAAYNRSRCDRRRQAVLFMVVDGLVQFFKETARAAWVKDNNFILYCQDDRPGLGPADVGEGGDADAGVAGHDAPFAPGRPEGGVTGLEGGPGREYVVHKQNVYGGRRALPFS